MALSRQTRNEINEWVQWWNYHHNLVDSMPLEQKVKWMMKALQGSYNIMTSLAREQDAKNRPFDLSNGGIAIPKTWRFEKRA